MSANRSTPGWIGYDWFKLIVAIILALLLLWVRIGADDALLVANAPTALPAQSTLAVPTMPAVPTAVPTNAPIATLTPTVAPTTEPTATPSVVPTIAPPEAIPVAITIPVDGNNQPFGPINIRGTAPAGSTIEILSGSGVLGEVVAQADGTWSFTYTPTTSGALDLAARLKGNTTASNPVRITVAAPTSAAATTDLAIMVPAEGATLPSGPITISGTGLAGSTVEVLDGDQVIGEAIVAADDTWNVTYTPSADGTASLAVRVKGGQIAQKPIRVTVGSGVQATCTSLVIGCDAWVTRKGGLMLRMRSAAGTDAPVVTRLPVGTQVRLLEGPGSASGYTWWRVKTQGGREGWVSGENLVLQPD